MGVWIEIQQQGWNWSSYIRSLPSWECGLKYHISKYVCHDNLVTPFVGVWIEMIKRKLLLHIMKSLPSWECGLKSANVFDVIADYGHSLRGSVDWNFELKKYTALQIGHSLRGSVDWNLWAQSRLWTESCHSLRGSVDWNRRHFAILRACNRHSLRGSVDWNLYYGKGMVDELTGHSLRGSVDWNYGKYDEKKKSLTSLPLWECIFNYILLGVGYINICKLSSIL